MGRIQRELYASRRANPEDRRLDMKNCATSAFTHCLGALGPDFNSYSRSHTRQESELRCFFHLQLHCCRYASHYHLKDKSRLLETLENINYYLIISSDSLNVFTTAAFVKRNYTGRDRWKLLHIQYCVLPWCTQLIKRFILCFRGWRVLFCVLWLNRRRPSARLHWFPPPPTFKTVCFLTHFTPLLPSRCS